MELGSFSIRAGGLGLGSSPLLQQANALRPTGVHVGHLTDALLFYLLITQRCSSQSMRHGRK